MKLFENFSSSTLGKIIDLLQEETFQQDDYIVRQAEVGATFYIITEGEVDVTRRKDGSDEQFFMRPLRAGEYFGEKALTNDSGARTANVACKSATVKCLTLDKDTFVRYIGVLPQRAYERNSSTEFRPRDHRGGSGDRARHLRLSVPAKTPEMRQSTELMPVLPKKELPRRKSMTLEDLERLKILGKGGYGKVYLVHLKGDTSKSYALKQMTKVCLRVFVCICVYLYVCL